MIPTPAENLKDTWTSIFRRKGKDGVYTRLFDNLDVSQRVILLTALKLNKSELPVIASVQNSNNWLILTTERLAWSIKGRREELETGTIRDATADLRKLQRSKDSKLEMQQLRLVTLECREYLIDLEPGEPLSGVWNVLKNLGARNRNSINR